MFRRTRIICAFRKHLCYKPETVVSSTDICATRKFASHAESTASKSNYESMVDRKLYLEAPYAGSAKSKISTVALADGGKKVEITWNDGDTSRYHSVWLRHNCHCPSCRLSTNQTVVNIRDVDLNAIVARAEKEGEHLLRVTWNDDDNHTGLFPLPFLKYYTYSGTALADKEKEIRMVFHDTVSVPEVAYDDVMTSDAGLYRWLKHLSDYGICLVKNLPSKPLEVKRVAQRIAPIQSTIYGDTFDVKDVPRPSNFAYTRLKLGLHMDQIMYESPPGIQLLHSLRFDKEVTGGESTFVDLFHVVEKLRQEHPQEFNDLVRIPATWETIHYDRDIPVHMAYQRPHISLNHNGQVVGLTWHPSLLTLQVKEEDVEPYYRAYKLMATMIDTFPSKYRLRLQEGDLISFNNRRILHGREEYNPNNGYRFLQGCYVQIDEFKSQVQVYANKMGDGKLAKRVGNMDWQ